MSMERADQYPEISGEDAGLVPPQSAEKQEWPKKIRTLTASELDRLTIDGLGRFYWDGKLVNYDHGSGRAEQKPMDLDRSAMDLLDRAAREIAHTAPAAEPVTAEVPVTPDAPAVEPVAAAPEPPPAPVSPDQPVEAPAHPALDLAPAAAAPVAAAAAAAAPVPVVEVRRDEVVRAVPTPMMVRSEKVRLSLSFWQSLGAILAILGLLVGAAGFAAQGVVAAADWGCRVGLVTTYCPPPPPEPKAPARPDIPA